MSFVAQHSAPKTESKSHHPGSLLGDPKKPFIQTMPQVEAKQETETSDFFSPQPSLLSEKENTFFNFAPDTVETTVEPAANSSSSEGSSPASIAEVQPEVEEATGNSLLDETPEVVPQEDALNEPQMEVGGEQEEFYPRSPQEDPNFKAVKENAGLVAEHQQRQNDPQTEAASAQTASPIAGNEVMGGAQANQVEAMNGQKPNEFDAAGFKSKLMERIASMQMPENLEQADNFEKNSNIGEINRAANQDLGAAQANAAGPIDAATQAEPDTAAVPEREVTALPEPDLGSTPDSIAANTAMPAPRPESQVSQPLQENMAQVDNAMADNEVTDEMLANSNEPTFTSALDQTNEARTHTVSAPQALRTQEGGTLSAAQQTAENQSNSQLQNMQTDREATLGSMTNQQNQTATHDSAERQRISTEINAIYNRAKSDVEGMLSNLETKTSEKFTAAADRAKQAFEKYVEKEMKAYKSKRYSGLIGKGRWLKDKLLGMPDEVNEFFKNGRQVYIDHMDKELTVISQFVAEQLTAAKNRIAEGRQEVVVYVEALPENLRSIGQEAADEIQNQFDNLQESVNAKQDELIDSLAQQYSEALEAVDARIEEMKAANAGLVNMVLGAIMGIIETILKIKNMLLNMLAKAAQAIGAIISDPIGFLSNFFEGIKLGFVQFGTNILKHLQAGFITWLTGAMGSVGLKMPEDIFSLKGIFSLTTQILGFTWDRIRAIGVKVIGEPIVKALETGFEMITILRNEGLAGLWEYIKEQFNDLKETVMGAIMGIIQTQVIQAGIKWLLGLLSPVGAFIKACMAIIDVVVFFVQKAAQIIELVNAFLDAILAVVSGSVGAVAKLIENALAKAVPVLIGFLASLLGISGLASKVTKIFQKIQQRVEKAITKLWMKLKEIGKKVLSKLGIGKNTSANDERTPEQKQKDLNDGIMEGTAYLKSKSKVSKSEADQGLEQIANKHRLKELKLHVVKDNPEGLDQVRVKGKVNPEKDGEIVNIEVDGGGKERISEYLIVPLFTVYPENPKEFERQMDKQINGINEMTCQKWLTNRTRFENEGRSKDALSDIRERIRADIADSYIVKNSHRLGVNLTANQLEIEAKNYAKTILTRKHAILHNPDQVAGGELMTKELYKDGDITNETRLKASALVGHLGTNSSIGSQWGYNSNQRVIGIKNHVNTDLQKVNESEKKTIKMNVKWK